MKAKIVVYLLLLLAGTPLIRAQEDVESFSTEKAVSYAYNHNAEVKNAGIDIKKGKQDVNATLSTGFPQISGRVEYTNYPALPVNLIPAEFLPGGQPGEFAEVRFGTSNNLDASVNATQMIFDGSFFAGLKASKMYVDLTQKEYQISKVNTRANVIKAYYNVLITKRNREILEKNKVVMEDLYEETKARYENGFVEEIEVDRVELSMSNIETQLQNAKRQEKYSYALLKFQMGYPLADSIQLTDSLDNIQFENHQLISESMPVEQTLDYQMLNQQIELTDASIQEIRSRYYPNAELFATYRQNAQRDEFNFLDADAKWFETALWGVRINIPIWDSFRKKANIQKEKLNREQIENRRDQLTNNHKRSLQETRKDYLNALDQLENQKKNLELSRKIFNTAVQKYEEGVGSSLEVDNARQTMFETQRQYVNALYNLLVAKTDLEKVLEIQ